MKPRHKKILGIVGDGKYPKPLQGNGENRALAMSRIAGSILQLEPKLVYVVPTKGVGTEILPVLEGLGIPFIIVAPYPDFSVPLSVYERDSLKYGCDKAKNIILLNRKNPLNGGETSIRDAIDFVADTCNGVLVMRSADSDEGDELDQFLSSKHQDTLFSVLYDIEED